MSKQFDKLVKIMKQLRGKNGCPWDRKQNFKSLRMNVIEEAYETVDAINKKNFKKLKEELGDLLLQVVFLSEIAEEKNKFNVNDVIKEVSDKLIRRHPHIFGNIKVHSASEVLSNWEEIKHKEKSKKEQKYILNDIPEILPALLKAYKTQNKAKRFGFSWKDVNEAIKKFKEEEKEFLTAIKNNKKSKIEEEFGDLLFSLVNIGIYYKINPEESLNKSIKKFKNRFNKLENILKRKKINLKDLSYTEKLKLWKEIKK